MNRSRAEQEAIRQADTLLRLNGLPTWTSLAEEGKNALSDLGLWEEKHTIHGSREEAKYCVYCTWREVIRLAMGEQP